MASNFQNLEYEKGQCGIQANYTCVIDILMGQDALKDRLRLHFFSQVSMDMTVFSQLVIYCMTVSTPGFLLS